MEGSRDRLFRRWDMNWCPGRTEVATFNAIDVETANADRATICQIGIAHVEDGQIVDEWKSLIDPEDWFDPWFVEDIHGITSESVQGAPTMPEIRDELRRRLRGSYLISHTSFDRIAFERAMERYELEQLQVTWMDSAKIARCCWPDEFGKRGWGLKNIASKLGISFQHHDALEDAKVSAEIVLRACKHTGKRFDEWIDIASSRKPGKKRETMSFESTGSVHGDLSGATIVFTGALEIPRREASSLAQAAGGKVASSVSKRTDVLVVGTQFRHALKGYEKSTKHRTAEGLIESGSEIQIISETDFKNLVELG